MRSRFIAASIGSRKAREDNPGKGAASLLSAVPLSEEMNVEKFRAAAVKTIRDLHVRKKAAIIVGGSGLYVRALTHGLSQLPGADPKLRAQLSELSLNECAGSLSILIRRLKARST